MLCCSFSAPTYQSVIRHIGSVRSQEPRFNVTCGIEGCPRTSRTYTSYRSFRRHLMEKHQQVMENREPHSIVELPHVQDYQEQRMMHSQIHLRCSQTSKHFFLLKMKGFHKAMQVALLLISVFQEEILSLKDVILCIQHGHDLNDSIRKVDELFSQVFCVPLSRCLDNISSKGNTTLITFIQQ